MPISLLRNMLRVLRSSPNLPNSELRSALLKRPSRSAAELRAAACSHKPDNLKVCGQACLLLHHLCGLCLIGQGSGTSKFVEALIWVRKIRGVIIKKTINVSVDVGMAVLPA